MMRMYLCLTKLARWKYTYIIYCSSTHEENRLQKAEALASAQHWQELTLTTDSYSLRSYVSPKSLRDNTLTIYIEGDGSAWIHGEYPSEDPTPKDPIGLRLALAQPSGAVAYLARPCQFITQPTLCNSAVWTSERFSQKAIQATDQAINRLKARTQAQKMILVGYSGGAAVALLVAARRHDVSMIISVAGNVNPHLWVNTLGMQPLAGSLDPRHFVNELSQIPQVYLVGGQDRVVSSELSDLFIEQFPKNARPRIINVKENGHVCCWVEQWPLLWSQITQKTPSPQ